MTTPLRSLIVLSFILTTSCFATFDTVDPDGRAKPHVYVIVSPFYDNVSYLPDSCRRFCQEDLLYAESSHEACEEASRAASANCCTPYSKCRAPAK
jgi:hypothetical protein